MAQNAVDEAGALAKQVSAMETHLHMLTARVDSIDHRGSGHTEPD
jgi:hypothetical protein